MKIKQMIATLLAGVLMLGNLSAVCLAAEGETVPTSDTAAETSEASPDEEADNGEAIDTGFTIPDGMTLPEGITVDENGNLSFDMNGWNWTTTGGGASEPETVEETITVGTVNVRSDTYLHLRTGPGMDQTIIGHLLRGTEVEVVGENGDWYEVVIPEMNGYVHKNYLDIAERTITTVIPGTGAETEMDTDFLMMLLAMMMSGFDSTETPDAEDSSNALTPDGNLTLVDDYAVNYEDGSGKQFITLTTKAGNVFYLVIDRDDKGEQNVHFMNLVDERDLLSLMDENEAAEFAPVTEPEVQPPTETENPTEDTEGEETDPGTEVEKPASKMNLAPVLILVLALVGGGGFFVYTKFFKGKGKKQQIKPDPDADYVEEDEDDYGLPEDLGGDEELDEDGLFDADDDEPV